MRPLPERDPKRPHIYLEFSASGVKLDGRLVIELFDDIAPRACRLLKTRLARRTGPGALQGSPVHKLVPGFALFAGQLDPPLSQSHPTKDHHHHQEEDGQGQHPRTNTSPTPTPTSTSSLTTPQLFHLAPSDLTDRLRTTTAGVVAVAKGAMTSGSGSGSGSGSSTATVDRSIAISFGRHLVLDTTHQVVGRAYLEAQEGSFLLQALAKLPVENHAGSRPRSDVVISKCGRCSAVGDVLEAGGEGVGGGDGDGDGDGDGGGWPRRRRRGRRRREKG